MPSKPKRPPAACGDSIRSIHVVSCRLQRLLGAINIAFRETRKAERLEVERVRPSAIHSESCLPIEGPSANRPAEAGRNVKAVVWAWPIDDRDHVRGEIDASRP